MRQCFRSGKQRQLNSRSVVSFLLAAIVIAWAGGLPPQPAEANEFQYAAVRPYEPAHRTLNAPEAIQWHQRQQKIRTEPDPANPNRQRIVATDGPYAGQEVFIDPNNNRRPINELQRAKNVHAWMSSGKIRELYGKDSQGKAVFAYEFVGQENRGLFQFDANGAPRKSDLRWPTTGRPVIPDTPVAVQQAPPRTQVSAVRRLATRPADAAALNRAVASGQVMVNRGHAYDPSGQPVQFQQGLAQPLNNVPPAAPFDTQAFAGLFPQIPNDVLNQQPQVNYLQPGDRGQW
jgi:hypothetical protein